MIGMVKVQIEKEIIRIQKAIEITENEIYVCKRNKNKIQKMDLLQKKYYYQQQIIEIQKRL